MVTYAAQVGKFWVTDKHLDSPVNGVFSQGYLWKWRMNRAVGHEQRSGWSGQWRQRPSASVQSQGFVTTWWWVAGFHPPPLSPPAREEHHHHAPWNLWRRGWWESAWATESALSRPSPQESHTWRKKRRWRRNPIPQALFPLWYLKIRWKQICIAKTMDKKMFVSGSACSSFLPAVTSASFHRWNPCSPSESV